MKLLFLTTFMLMYILSKSQFALEKRFYTSLNCHPNSAYRGWARDLEICTKGSNDYHLTTQNSSFINVRLNCKPGCHPSECKTSISKKKDCSKSNIVGYNSVEVSSGLPPKLKETGFFAELYENSDCSGQRQFTAFYSEAFCHERGEKKSTMRFYNNKKNRAEIFEYSDSNNCTGQPSNVLLLPFGVCSKYLGEYHGIVTKIRE
eukprot:gene8318-142_t